MVYASYQVCTTIGHVSSTNVNVIGMPVLPFISRCLSNVFQTLMNKGNAFTLPLKVAILAVVKP